MRGIIFPPLYMLDEQHQIVQATDLWTWVAWQNDPLNSVVAKMIVEDWLISTVFLGVSPSLRFGPNGEAPRQMFETMVFSTEGRSHRQRRYDTWAQALQGHADMVRITQAELGVPLLLTAPCPQ